jgi:hypothetical protein
LFNLDAIALRFFQKYFNNQRNPKTFKLSSLPVWSQNNRIKDISMRGELWQFDRNRDHYEANGSYVPL